MAEHFYYDSQGQGRLHGCRWFPEGKPNAVVQVLHGIAEYVERYDDFARYLNSRGYLVVAEDHMGHGKSICEGGIQGYFHKGWFTAVADSYRLLEMTRAEYPDIPYILLGHSMGSFMARTILAKYPDSGISGAVICGTAWQPRGLLAAAIPLCKLVCCLDGEQNPSPKLQNLVFGSYNRRVENPKTDFDWLNRDEKAVAAYVADPLCGFTATAGLLRDMLTGLKYIENPRRLLAMRKDLPIFLIAGGDDPVGAYGKGVEQAADAFRKAGMQNVAVKIYPQGRHEILNEINKERVYADVADWIEQVRK